MEESAELFVDELDSCIKYVAESYCMFDSVSVCGDGTAFADFFGTVQRQAEKRRDSHGVKRKASHARDVVFLVCDCTDGKYDSERVRESWIGEMAAAFVRCRNAGCDRRFVVVAAVPSPKMAPEGIEALSEREYSCGVSRSGSTMNEQFYKAIEDLAKTFSKKGEDVILLRALNVVGAGVSTVSDGFCVARIIEDARVSGGFDVSEKDFCRYESFLSLKDTVAFSHKLAAIGKRSNIYNLNGEGCMSVADIKIYLHSVFSDRFSLAVRCSASDFRQYGQLDSLKLKSLIGNQCELFAKMRDVREIVYREAVRVMGMPYDTMRYLRVYQGKLGIIRREELNMLKIVDEICEKNGIKYFLAGGSLLGAIRHGGMIPWDDDLDIGMLREDFEKFRRVCPQLIPPTHTYESPQIDCGERTSHYHFDKIRKKGTYFSTRFSNMFKINDGIFLDVIVYDKTSNIPAVATFHIFLIRVVTFLLNVRWRRGTWPKGHKKKTKLLLPLIKLIPINVYHKVFEIIVRWYEKKKDARTLIDGLGQNIKKGPFEKKWLETTKRAMFDGVASYVPTGFDGYLKHFYGEKYMDMLPICKRVSGHRLARIDMGAFLFEENPELRGAELSLEGELM